MASDRSLHCLSMSHKKDALLIWANDRLGAEMTDKKLNSYIGLESQISRGARVQKCQK